MSTNKKESTEPWSNPFLVLHQAHLMLPDLSVEGESQVRRTERQPQTLPHLVSKLGSALRTHKSTSHRSRTTGQPYRSKSLSPPPTSNQKCLVYPCPTSDLLGTAAAPSTGQDMLWSWPCRGQDGVSQMTSLSKGTGAFHPEVLLEHHSQCHLLPWGRDRDGPQTLWPPLRSHTEQSWAVP